ncbi:MAG: cupin domain-containing protein [Deltaproteobacteria bacterium]|nr:cupin domain-containing protein [Deltaproteobacteria bacterium]
MTNFRSVSDAMQFSAEKMKKNGLFETERMICDVYCFEPGQSQSPHTHEGSDKVYFVLRGKGKFQVGGEEKDLAESDIALASSGQRHGVSNPGPERLVVLVFVTPKPSH